MSLQTAHHQYERVSNSLQSGESLRCKLFALDSFLTEAEKNLPLYEVFLLELSELLPDVDNIQALRGIHPDRLTGCLNKVYSIQNQSEEIAELDSWIDFIENLRRCTAVLFAYCNDFQSIYHLIYPNRNIPEWLPDYRNITPSEHLRRIFDVARQHDEQFSEFLEEIAERINKSSPNIPGKIFIPVIEHCRGIKETELSGRIVSVYLDYLKHSGQPHDQLDIAYPHHVEGAQLGSDHSVNPVLTAVKSALKQQFPQAEDHTFQSLIRFDPIHAGYEGRSAELATGVLLYASLLNLYDARSHLTVKSGVSITGLLNPDGDVQEVDPDSLELKVEAVFFSNQHTIAVPDSQQQTARTVADKLSERFPNKSIAVFGIRSLEDLVNDRRLTNFHRDNPVSFYARKTWENKFSVTSLATIFLLSIIIFRLIYGPIDQEPYSASFSGQYMYIENSAGQILDQIEVGERTVRMEDDGGGSMKQYAFFDVNDNNIPDVFWIENAHEGTGDIDIIYARCGQTDSTLWNKELIYDLSFPNTPDVQSSLFTAEQIYIKDLGFDFPVAIVRTRHRTYFPSQIMLLNAQNGEIINTYHHSGKISDMVLHDFTEDGKEEIFIAGVNNSFDQAFIAKLDPHKMQGQGPHTSRYYTSDFNRAEEIKYIRIPQSEIGKALRYINRYNEVNRVHLREDQEILHVRVDEYALSSDDLLDAEEGRLHYYFDYDLKILGISRANSYDLAARQLYDEGYIDKIPDHQYFEDFSDSLLYLVDEEWIQYGELSNAQKNLKNF